MKVLKSVLGVSALLAFTACGSSNTPTAIGSSSLVNSYSAISGTQTGYGQTGYNTYSVPGGTKTLTPVLTGTASSYGTKVYSVSPSVAAGDQIIVSASGSVVYAVGAILGGLGSSTSQAYLNGLNISVSGYQLGSGLYATYTVPAAGTLSIEAQASLMNIAHTDKTTFTTAFTGGVYIAHCTSTSGSTMQCPAGY